jgi:hypothetical protein
MNKVAIAVVTLLFTGLSASAQQGEPQRIKLVKIETNGSSQQTTTTPHQTLSPEQEIRNLEYQLQALDNKEALIRQNPEETLIATQEGWFEKTEATRLRIKARINELKK